jgi:hypothetical protein
MLKNPLCLPTPICHYLKNVIKFVQVAITFIQRMQPNLSTPIQEVITIIQEYNQICPPLSKKQLPLSKNVTKFVHPCSSNDRLCLRM